MKNKLKNKMKAVSSAFFAIMAMMFATISASAAEIDTEAVEKTVNFARFSGVTKWIKSITADVKTIGYAIGTLSIIILGIVLITAGQEGLGKGKRYAAGILAGIAVIAFGSSIITDLANTK